MVEHALSLGYSRGANCERVASALGGPLSMDIDHSAVVVVGREYLSSNCGEIIENSIVGITVEYAPRTFEFRWCRKKRWALDNVLLIPVMMFYSFPLSERSSTYAIWPQFAF